jgi:hypothetical protein
LPAFAFGVAVPAANAHAIADADEGQNAVADAVTVPESNGDALDDAGAFEVAVADADAVAHAVADAVPEPERDSHQVAASDAIGRFCGLASAGQDRRISGDPSALAVLQKQTDRADPADGDTQTVA